MACNVIHLLSFGPQEHESNPHYSLVTLNMRIIRNNQLRPIMETKFTPSDVSEDRTSATGSNVAPRSIGRQFSPTEETTKAQWGKKRN